MSQFKDLQKDVCDLPELPEPPDKICPTCTIDPNYTEPIWYNTSEPYLNLKICEYQVAITSNANHNSAVNTAHLEYLAQKSVKQGVREIIRHFSKLELDSLVCAYPPARSSQVCRLYLPPELLKKFDEQESDDLPQQVVSDIDYNKRDPENRFNLDGLEIKAYVKDVYYGDNSEVFKVLVSIPAEDIDLLPEAPFGEDEREEIIREAEEIEQVILDGRALKNNILQLQAVFKLYAKYQSLYYILQKISILQDVGEDGTRKLRLTRFPPLFKKFKDTLSDVLADNDYKLRRSKGRKTADKIKIVFDNSNRLQPYKIKTIYAKYPGCRFKKIKNIGSLKELSNNQTLMHYIANMEDMIEEITVSTEPIPWLDFVAENTFPPVTIDFGNADSKNEELDSCIDDQYLSDIKDRILEEGLNFREAIEFQFNNQSCRTIEDYRNNNLIVSTKRKIKKEKLTKEQRKEQRKQSRIEPAEQALKNEIKSIKSDIRLLKTAPQPSPPSGASGLAQASQIVVDIEANNELIEDLEKKLALKKQELQNLQKAKRNKKFPTTDALSKENLVRLWKTAQGPEPKKKGLFKRLAEDRRLRLEDRRVGRKKQGRTILAQVNPCDWSAVLFDSIECLLGGMSLEEAIPIIVRSTLSKSSPFVLETILQGLPPDVQLEVERQVKAELRKISDDALRAFKTPWDSAREQQATQEETDDNSNERDQELNAITQDPDVPTFTNEEIGNIKAEIEEIKQERKSLEEELTVLVNLEPDSPAPAPAPAGTTVEWMDYRHKYRFEPIGSKFSWKQWTPAGGLPETWSPVTNPGGIEAVKKTWTDANPGQTPPWDNPEPVSIPPQPLTGEQQEQLAKIESLEQQIEQSNQRLLRWEALLSRTTGQLEQQALNPSPTESEQVQVARGSVDLGNIASIIFNAYVDAILQYAGIDRLTEMIDKIPGANVFKKVFLQTACPTIDDLKFGIEDLFGSLQLGVCGPNANGYMLPSIPELRNLRFAGISSSLDIVIGLFRESLVQLIESVILALFVKILDLIEKAQCDAIGALGSLIANQVAGQDSTRNGLLDAINDAFCLDGGNPQDTQDDLLSRAGLPAEAKAGIASGISRAMSPKEIKQALLDCSEVPARVWSAIYAVIQVEYPQLLEFVSSPDDVKEIFCTMGSLLSEEQRGALDQSIQLESQTADRPIDGSICLDNQQRDEWDERRKKFYEDQGLPKEAAEDFVNGLNQQALTDLADLLDLLVNGPEGILDNIFREAFSPPDPDCVESLSVIPRPPPEVMNLQKQISDGLFGSISSAFSRDMIGQRHAMIDNILADSRGLRLTGFLQHESRVNFDLLFPNAANSIEDHREKYDKSGYLTRALMAQKVLPKDTFEQNQEGDPPQPEANHLFPQTIGAYSRERLLELTDTLAFDSNSTPTFTLGFRDISEDEDQKFDKGFNLNFNNHVKTGQVFNRNSTYAVKKVDVNRIKNDKVQKTTDFNIRIPYGLESNRNLISQLDQGGELQVPFINHLFESYIKNIWSSATSLDVGNISDLYDKTNAGLVRSLIKTLMVDERDQNELPTGFKFGYNDDRVGYEDLLYVNPEATDDPETWEYTYENEDKVLGKSATNNKRVKFLDPERYGGRYTRPKLYIEPVKHDGWYGILQVVVPEIDGCEPRRSDFLYLEEISERVSSLQNSIPIDKRMEFDKDCTQEPAFDKLLSPSSLAYIEGAVTTIIRTYVVETILRTMPLVSHLKLDFIRNYDEALLSLVVDKMEEQMKEQGGVISRIKNYTYWVLFLDQMVQASFRKIKDGILPKEERLVELLREANQVTRNYVRPDRDDISLIRAIDSYVINDNGDITDVTFKYNRQYNKSVKRRAVRLSNALAYGAFGEFYQDKLKEKSERRVGRINIKTLSLKTLQNATREYDVHTNIDLCKQILRYNVRAELERYGSILDEALIPQAYIQDLGKYFIGASGLCKNHTIQAGLSEIETPVGDSPLPYGDINEVVSNPLMTNPLEGISLTDEEKQSGVFFLEKYLVVTPKRLTAAQVAQEGLTEVYNTQFEGVTGIREFQDELRTYSGNKELLVSEAMGDASLILDPSERPFDYQGSIGIKFGVRLCYSPPEGFEVPNATTKDRAFRAKPAEGYAGSEYYFPVAKFEQDISDRKLSEIDLNDSSLGEDLKCYVDKLALTEEFDFFVNKLLATRRVSGLVGIYFYDGFIDSIGLGQDEREEGNENRGNQKWKGKILDDTKDRCRALFASFYRSMDSEDNSIQNSRDKNRRALFSNLMPNGLFNIDGSVKWWQTLRLVDRPFDRNGKDCAEDLIDIFGE